MAYRFEGFFTTPAAGLIEDAAARWPGASVRSIHEQLNGVGLRLPSADVHDPAQYQMVVNFEDELPDWSKRYPENTFVYIVADCFGGRCDHFGYVCKNGKKIDIVEEEQEEGLTHLLNHIGAKLGNNYSRTYFAPFERSYPW